VDETFGLLILVSCKFCLFTSV